MTQRRAFLTALAALGAAGFAARSAPAHAGTPPRGFDFSPQQSERVRAPLNPGAASALKDYRFVVPDALSVAVAPYGPPIASYATDARTIVGADPDYAQLVADALGLKLILVPVAWQDWPLGLASRKYDAVISNVGVTEQRKQKFDFSTYRLGLHGFYVPVKSAIQSIREPKDIAGLRVITGSGSIQERILIEWNRQNVAHGLAPVSLQYYADQDSALLALQSGRADAELNPHAALAYEAATVGRIRLVGIVNAGWPLRADVAVATRRNSGLASVLTTVTNGLIDGGQYRGALARWGLADEAVAHSETNPPGYKDA